MLLCSQEVTEEIKEKKKKKNIEISDSKITTQNL